MMPRKTQIPSPVIHLQGNFSLSLSFPFQLYMWSWFVSGWGSGQVPIFCQFTGSREVHEHRLWCFKGPTQKVPALFQSHAMFLAPATQHWGHLPEQARPQSGFVVLWKTIATALEITEKSAILGHPRKAQREQTGTFFRKYTVLQEVLCLS